MKPRPQSLDQLEALNIRVHEGTGALIDKGNVPVPAVDKILAGVKSDTGVLMKEKVAQAGSDARRKLGGIFTDLLLEVERGESRPVVKAVEMARGLGVDGEALQIVHDTAEALTRRLIALDTIHYVGAENLNDVLTLDDVPDMSYSRREAA